MLAVRLSKGLTSKPDYVKDLQVIVVEDEYGQPLHLFMRLNDNSVLSVSPADTNFSQVLKDIGIMKRCDYEVK